MSGRNKRLAIDYLDRLEFAIEHGLNSEDMWDTSKIARSIWADILAERRATVASMSPEGGRLGLYKLVGKEAVPCAIEEFGASYERSDLADHKSDPRRVAWTDIGDDCYVSTIFLGIDHSFFSGPPLLFETMVFWKRKAPKRFALGGRVRESEYEGNYQERYTTWDQAEEGHHRIVAMVERGSIRPPSEEPEDVEDAEPEEETNGTNGSRSEPH